MKQNANRRQQGKYIYTYLHKKKRLETYGFWSFF
jgi:hypothetical protein